MQSSPYTYDKNYGNVYGPPGSGGCAQQTPLSWGVTPFPGSLSTAVPSSTGTAASSPYGMNTPAVSQDYYPQEYSEFKDPVEKAKEKVKKLDKKMKKQDRKRKRKLEDAKTAAEFLIALGVWNALMWAVPCFGNKWYTKMFNGFGIGFTKITISLFSIHVYVECHVMNWGLGLNDDTMSKLNPEHQICKLMQHMNGTHTLQAAKTLACAIPGYDACYIMSTLWWSSYMLIFAFSVSAICSLFGSMFLYYYWYVDHLQTVRTWALGWYAASPFLGVVCFAFYNVIAPDVGDLPKSWTTMVTTVNAGTGLGEIQAIGDDVFWNKFGWCWFFSFITVAFSLAAPTVWGVWFMKHYREDDAEMAALEEEVAMEEKIWQMEDQVDYLKYGVPPETDTSAAWGQGYGATGYGQQPAYGQQQGYGGGYGQQPQYQGYTGY